VAQLITEGAIETAVRIAARYIGEEKGADYVGSTSSEHVIVRVTQGDLRIWDFSDEYDSD